MKSFLIYLNKLVIFAHQFFFTHTLFKRNSNFTFYFRVHIIILISYVHTSIKHEYRFNKLLLNKLYKIYNGITHDV